MTPVGPLPAPFLNCRSPACECCYICEPSCVVGTYTRGYLCVPNGHPALPMKFMPCGCWLRSYSFQNFRPIWSRRSRQQGRPFDLTHSPLSSYFGTCMQANECHACAAHPTRCRPGNTRMSLRLRAVRPGLKEAESRAAKVGGRGGFGHC